MEGGSVVGVEEVAGLRRVAETVEGVEGTRHILVTLQGPVDENLGLSNKSTPEVTHTTSRQ